MAGLCVWFVSLCAALVFAGSDAFKWTSDSALQDGKVRYSCEGKAAAVTFPWQYDAGQGEKIRFIRWTHEGVFTSHTIATLTDGDFLPAKLYMPRISQAHYGAGIALTNLTSSDSGNYSVEVSVLDHTGILSVFKRHARLLVAGKLLVENDQVKVTQLPVAVKVKDKWSVGLACGKFKYLGVPPFPVYWTTPSGESIKQWSEWQDGSYLLLLPNPVRGGNYSCQVPQLFNKEACATSADRERMTDSVMVDETLARLSLLEAHQAEVIQDNTKLNDEVQQLNATNQNLEANNEELKADLQTLKQQMNQSISPQLEALKNRLNKHVSFNARPASDRFFSSGQTVTWDDVLLNHGYGFNTTTNQFQVAVTGVYFFSLSTRSYSGKYYSDADIVTSSGVRVCRIDSLSYNDVGACSGAVRLSQGQRVWVQTFESWAYFQASACTFSGFLITPDP